MIIAEIMDEIVKKTKKSPAERALTKKLQNARYALGKKKRRETRIQKTIESFRNVERDIVKQVGRKHNNKNVSYKSVHYDKFGWAAASSFLPRDYDMCSIKTPRGNISGWHTGNTWDGLNLRKTDQIIAWKLDLIGFKQIRDRGG